MNHIGTKNIETPRLILRRFEASDAQAMFDNWASDSEVTKYLTWPAHANVSVSKEVLGLWLCEYERDDCYRWAITLKENGLPIGSIDVVGWVEGGEAAEIGYCIGRRWWHQGVMSEALSGVLDFLLRQVGVRRVAACHDVDNPHSGGVMRKCGMKFEGIREGFLRNNQGEVKTAHYSIELADR